MSPARPDHTDTDNSMMFMAAKPATATRRRSADSREVSVCWLVSCIGAAAKPAWASAAITSASLPRPFSTATLTRFAARFARALRTPGTLIAARSTERMQPPQRMFSTARVRMMGASSRPANAFVPELAGSVWIVMALPERRRVASGERRDRRRVTARLSEAERSIARERVAPLRHSCRSRPR